MKRFAFLSLLFVSNLASYATPPPLPEPLDEAFSRFRKSYPAQCEDLFREIQKRVPQSKDGKSKALFEGLERYLGNLSKDDIPRLERAISDKTKPKELLLALNFLVTDIVGFRRSLDEFVIEASAGKSLLIDDVLLSKLRDFWKEEYHYSLRFRDDAMALGQK